MSLPNNPGGALAAEIDAEVAKFREVQQNVQKLRNDLQIVMGQLAENEMVLQELSLLDENANIFKMVGPVLIKNSQEDAKDTVGKRIEFITSEKDRLEKKLADLEKTSVEIAQRVQQMQGVLQQATVAAVQQIQQQHQEG
jgi:prefoldin beta subunit